MRSPAGIEAGGAVIAIVPEWFSDDGLKRLEMARTLLDTDRVVIHVTQLPPLAATALASLASALGPRLPSAGLVASRAPRARGAAAPDHLAGQRDRPQAPRAEPRPARHQPHAGQRVRRHQPPRAGGAQAPGDTSRPAPRTTAQPADRRQPQRRRALADRRPSAACTRSASSRRRDGPAYWGTTKLVEGVICPADPDQLARRAAAERRRLGVPLVRRADRPQPVPDVRAPRSSPPPPRGRAHVGRGSHLRPGTCSGRKPASKVAPR